ncbi:MAG: hypothetical protein K6U74_18185 [Firmicutes bacterium]|nr:hypothetical protein [Bacillota bacterium]
MAEIPVGRTEQPISAQAALEEDEWYELLPIEKKLITYSLGLGIILLIVFIFAFGITK